MNHLAIRADGSPEMGYGHLVRTGALAQKFLENGHRVTYLTRTPSGASDVCPNEAGVYHLGENEIEDALAWLDENKPDALLTDSYDVDTEYQRKLRESVPTLATVTDDTRFTLCCDVNINGNVYATELDYDWICEKPEMLLGTEYLLMREEFQRLADEEPPWRKNPEQAIITMGGSDDAELTPVVIRAFDGFDVQIDAIIGPGFSEEQERKARVAADNISADVCTPRNPKNLAERMFQADFGVCTASSTTYEMLALGTPIVSQPVAKNQEHIATALAKHGAATVLEKEDGESAFRDGIEEYIADPMLRRKRREIGRDLVDPRGKERVANAIHEVVGT
jgi:UDP-2,4-diacetamido-2,4,6-trideoxy-beta-L-altropyranose hydrolase